MWRLLRTKFGLALAGVALLAAMGATLRTATMRDVAGAWAALWAPRPALGPPIGDWPAAPFLPPVLAGTLRDPALVEVSGLAASRRDPSVLWAINDSGNAGRLYAIARDGRLLRRFDLDVPSSGDADWEDLTTFDFAGTSYLLIADVGDNWGWRRDVQLWALEEPALAEAAARVVPRFGISLRYEDGPRDCEAVAVDERGTLLLVSKRSAPPVLYELALAPLIAAGGGEGIARATGKLEQLPLPTREAASSPYAAALHMPTALALSPGDRAAFVLSYAAGWYYPRAPGEPWAHALARAPQRLALPPLPLAEAATFARGSLYVTSEREPFALIRWPAPLFRFDPALEPAAHGLP